MHNEPHKTIDITHGQHTVMTRSTFLEP